MKRICYLHKTAETMALPPENQRTHCGISILWEALSAQQPAALTEGLEHASMLKGSLLGTGDETGRLPLPFLQIRSKDAFSGLPDVEEIPMKICDFHRLLTDEKSQNCGVVPKKFPLFCAGLWYLSLCNSDQYPMKESDYPTETN